MLNSDVGYIARFEHIENSPGSYIEVMHHPDSQAFTFTASVDGRIVRQIRIPIMEIFNLFPTIRQVIEHIGEINMRVTKLEKNIEE